MFHLTHANSAHASAVATKKHFRLHFSIVAFRAPCRSEPRATTPLCPYLPLAKGPITSPRGTHFRSNHKPGSLRSHTSQPTPAAAVPAAHLHCSPRATPRESKKKKQEAGGKKKRRPPPIPFIVGSSSRDLRPISPRSPLREPGIPTPGG
ncbi:hypothetical protein B296_00027845 [Ensete ventricosum]|uniref:Uncharacterized protein n=1 Tax=Ensete ventricosum TaxID=4639 RepID=A0A427A4V6_ENSVE|nr:hypothetical protein B296_00027845 [Ensete ventricosum]